MDLPVYFLDIVFCIICTTKNPANSKLTGFFECMGYLFILCRLGRHQ